MLGDIAATLIALQPPEPEIPPIKLRGRVAHPVWKRGKSPEYLERERQRKRLASRKARAKIRKNPKSVQEWLAYKRALARARRMAADDPSTPAPLRAYLQEAREKERIRKREYGRRRRAAQREAISLREERWGAPSVPMY